jgi:hypothetical protein
MLSNREVHAIARKASSQRTGQVSYLCRFERRDMDGQTRRDGGIVLVDATCPLQEVDAMKLATLLASDGYTGVRVARFEEAVKVFSPDTGRAQAGFRYGL